MKVMICYETLTKRGLCSAHGYCSVTELSEDALEDAGKRLLEDLRKRGEEVVGNFIMRSVTKLDA